MPILPIEPNPQDSADALQQKLDSERIGGIIEDFLADFYDEGAVRDTNQLLLGEPNAPRLLDAVIRLPESVDMQRSGDELGREVVSAMRSGMATDIENDYDEFVYQPLAFYTLDKKKRQQLEKPDTPLYGTGLLVDQMRYGWTAESKWEGNTLTVSWGPTGAEDMNPSDKYHDMFFGNPGTGKGHTTKIPRRYPYVSNKVVDQISHIISDFLKTKSDQSAATTPQDQNTLWTS
jgi:hypothetical protein